MKSEDVAERDVAWFLQSRGCATGQRWNICKQEHFTGITLAQNFRLIAPWSYLDAQVLAAFKTNYCVLGCDWIGLTCENADTFMPLQDLFKFIPNKLRRPSWNVQCSCFLMLFWNLFNCNPAKAIFDSKNLEFKAGEISNCVRCQPS